MFNLYFISVNSFDGSPVASSKRILLPSSVPDADASRIIKLDVSGCVPVFGQCFVSIRDLVPAFLTIFPGVAESAMLLYPSRFIIPISTEYKPVPFP